MQASADPKETSNAFGTLAHKHQHLNKIQPIFQLIDVSVPNKNKTCDASTMAANEHKLLNKSKISACHLIDRFIQHYQSQLQQDVINFSLSNAFSIAKLDSRFRDLQCQSFSNIKLGLDFSNFQCQLSLGIKADSNFSNF